MSIESGENDDLHALAKALLEVVPLVMRFVRAEMRAHRNAELSVPQFRVLGYVKLRSRVSLSAIADHMGLTAASMSKMVDGLATRGLIKRAPDPADRRRVAIAITEKGERAWAAAWSATCAAMVRRLQGTDSIEMRELSAGLEILRRLFAEVGDGLSTESLKTRPD